MIPKARPFKMKPKEIFGEKGDIFQEVSFKSSNFSLPSQDLVSDSEAISISCRLGLSVADLEYQTQILCC